MSSTARAAAAPAARTVLPPAPEDLHVQLEMKLVNWGFADFRLLVKTSTPLHLLKREIVERHGRMSQLHLWRGAVASDTEMTDDSRTLAEYGIVGKRGTEAPEVVVLFYNFVPYKHDDSLLLATHTRDRAGVST